MIHTVGCPPVVLWSYCSFVYFYKNWIKKGKSSWLVCNVTHYSDLSLPVLYWSIPVSGRSHISLYIGLNCFCLFFFSGGLVGVWSISWDLTSNFCFLWCKRLLLCWTDKEPPPPSLGGLVLLRAAVRQTAPPFTLRPSNSLINTVSGLWETWANNNMVGLMKEVFYVLRLKWQVVFVFLSNDALPV